MSAEDISDWARGIQQWERTQPPRSIRKVDTAIQAKLREDTGGDGALSHGRALGRATTRVTSSNGTAEVAASGSRRVWGILQGGTSGHTVEAGAGGLLRTPYGPRPRVQVRGVPARHTFTEGAQVGLRLAQADLESSWVRSVS